MRFNLEEVEAPQADNTQYPFQVIEATDGKSKSGNDMITIVLVVDHNGHQKKIYDYLPSHLGWKIKSFLTAIGKEKMLSKGEVTSLDCYGAAGLCTLKAEVWEGKVQYRVNSYIRASFENGEAAIKNIRQSIKPVADSSQKDDSFDDDDLPF